MMGDNRPLDHLRHMEFLNICLEDNLQPCPGTCPSEICSHPGPDEPCQEYAWPFDPPQSTRPDAHHGNSGMEPTRLEDCSFQGEARKTPASLRSVGDSCPLGSPQQNQSSSTQVVFWAGILQAQMCVLDLEEELEKTEGLRAELRCCIPPSSKDFLGDVDLSPSLPTADEDPEDDSSGPEEENQTWPKGQMPGSSPEWGAEEDSIFFDNPLFLESPCSDTSAEGECFSWGYPDGKTWPHSPETLDSPLQEGTGLWRPGSELCLGSNTADHGGCTTPPFPVPPYKMHPCMALGSTEEAPTVPLDQKGEDSQTPQSLSDLAPPILENLQTEDSSWPQELLISQNRGERDAGCFQEPMPCTLAPWGSQVSHLESGSPETEGRGSGPRPSPVSSQEGGSQVQLCNLKWPKDASHPSLLEKDELELSSLKKEETAEVPNLRQEVEYEDTARTEEAPAAQHQVHLTSAEGLPESLMPQAQSPEEFRRPSSGNKLANNIRNDKGAWNLALRLYQLNGFRKSEVAAHLQKKDEEDAARPEKDQPCASAGKISSPFLQMAHDPTMPTYKQGILARKMHHDADGKKTPWGKRGWKMFHTLLRGMALYFLKGEGHWLDGESLVGHMVDEPVGVHHSLASPATHYTKKPHVFQLRTADWRLYLFQAPTAKEMASWIARINLAAATHSAPPFPAAVGSQRRFVRPILPMSPAQSSLEEQHRSHENCLDAASDDLLDLQRKLPERRGRSRELEEYRLRKEYLEHEKTRYETYVQLLVARLHFPLGDLAMWEDQLGKEAEGTQDSKPSLKKSHSSPSLHQDEAPTTAKVKRNISERRTYRKIIPKRNRNQL
ncbi:PH and SEC7 domain-containing protein 4 isoform X3 [Meriones unguiculatus]|uniref:PH and SEC7 domain-containing protein 4 isoform X3 n=1 Tax=Meriones unguiculatus TaxID=10047 RepID=UPI000B4F9B18|nr:PH and SEC7 domain-containing protein 4 isoform X3 [Meriones unguiculatus]